MLRVRKNSLGGARFNDPAEVHHRNPVREITNHAQVVGNEQVGDAQFLLQISEQVQNLRLDRDIEGRNRLVADDESRLYRQGPGDTDPLALAPRKFVRITPDMGGVELNPLEEFLHPPGPLGFVRTDLETPHAFGHGIPHAHARVQGGHGILKNNLDLASIGTQGGLVQGHQVDPVKEHPARLGGGQTQNRTARRRLATTRLPHHSQGRSRCDLECHVGDRLDMARGPLKKPLLDGEPGPQAFDAQQGIGGSAHSASPSKRPWATA